MTGLATILRADARALPLPDTSVDLIVTSPPYYALRSYTDGGEHYAGQIGSERTPAEYIDSLIDCTREWMRVLKPSGSMFINLGDKYTTTLHSYNYRDPGTYTRATPQPDGEWSKTGWHGKPNVQPERQEPNAPPKSLMLLPERYRIACADRLGLIVRAVVVWAKINPLPESVTDRVRRSHEDWVHLVKQPRYYAAVDTIRQPHTGNAHDRGPNARVQSWQSGKGVTHRTGHGRPADFNPLGALPGSVWEIATEPLVVPEHLGVDHYACVDADTEIMTRRGWLRHDEVRAGDEVAGYDLDTGLVRWTTCHGVHRYDYDSDLIAVDKRDLSMRLTPNHRTVVQKRRGIHGHRGPVEVVRADELAPQHFIPRSAEWEDGQPTKSIGADLAALCGWIAAEGWYHPSGNVYVYQSPDANPDHVDTIRNLLTRLAPEYPPTIDRGVYPSRDRWRVRAQHNGQRLNLGSYATRAEAQAVWRAWRDEHDLDGIREVTKVYEWRGRPAPLTTWRLPRGLAGEIRRLMPDKRFTWDLANLPADEARALLNAFIDGDGHRRPDGRISVFQHLDNKVTVDVLQAIAVRLGYKTSLRDSGGRWVLYLTTGGRSITLRGTNGVLNPIPRKHYKGIVWCPTTGTGTFIARRNGQVFITGNSYPTALPRRIILGWSPSGICVECGQGRRPVVDRERAVGMNATGAIWSRAGRHSNITGRQHAERSEHTITGEACACPEPTAPTRPSVVLDPFGGTGTTALVAKALGRHGISVDRSMDYCRLAGWRTTDPDQIAKAMRVDKPPRQVDDQLALDLTSEATA